MEREGNPYTSDLEGMRTYAAGLSDIIKDRDKQLAVLQQKLEEKKVPKKPFPYKRFVCKLGCWGIVVSLIALAVGAVWWDIRENMISRELGNVQKEKEYASAWMLCKKYVTEYPDLIATHIPDDSKDGIVYVECIYRTRSDQTIKVTNQELGRK